MLNTMIAITTNYEIETDNVEEECNFKLRA